MAENLTTNKRPTAHLRTIHVKDDHSLISHEPRVGLFATYRGHATRPGNVILAALPKVSGPFSLDAPNQMWLYHPGAVTTARCVTNLRAFGPTRGRIHRRRTTRVAVPHGRAAAVRSGRISPVFDPRWRQEKSCSSKTRRQSTPILRTVGQSDNAHQSRCWPVSPLRGCQPGGRCRETIDGANSRRRKRLAWFRSTGRSVPYNARRPMRDPQNHGSHLCIDPVLRPICEPAPGSIIQGIGSGGTLPAKGVM